jgi:uncharacterized membrane protein
MTDETPSRPWVRYPLAAFYMIAGIIHLRSPAPFLAITPDWVPYPEFVIAFTGVCEIAGAVGVMTSRFRRAAGAMLALYAVCVYPANIKHALEGIAVGGSALGWGYHGPRLALQPVIIWWALYASGCTSWPFGRRKGIGASSGET